MNTEQKLPETLEGFLKLLKENGVKEYALSDKLSTYLDFKAREKGVPYHGRFELTPLCNLDCKMCYVHIDKEKLANARILSFDEWKSLMSQAIDAGMMCASLTGGECLAHPDFEKIYLYLQSRGVEVTVLTNGVLLDKKRTEFFKAHPPKRIQITLYGQNDDVYMRVTGKRAFNKVYENIKYAIDASLAVTLAVTPNRFLSDDAKEVIKLASALNVRYNINPSLFEARDETGRAGQNNDVTADEYIELYKLQRELSGKSAAETNSEELTDVAKSGGKPGKGIKCGAGRSVFTINWKGMMYACVNIPDIYENALELGVKEAWERINRKANDYPVPAECEECSYRNVCLRCVALHKKGAPSGHVDRAVCERTFKTVKAGLAEL